MWSLSIARLHPTLKLRWRKAFWEWNALPKVPAATPTWAAWHGVHPFAIRPSHLPFVCTLRYQNTYVFAGVLFPVSHVVVFCVFVVFVCVVASLLVSFVFFVFAFYVFSLQNKIVQIYYSRIEKAIQFFYLTFDSSLTGGSQQFASGEIKT